VVLYFKNGFFKAIEFFYFKKKNPFFLVAFYPCSWILDYCFLSLIFIRNALLGKAPLVVAFSLVIGLNPT